MPFQLIYWVLMLLWLVFGLWANWPAPNTPGGPFRPLGGTLLLFILLLLLGWRVFGAPAHP